MEYCKGYLNRIKITPSDVKYRLRGFEIRPNDTDSVIVENIEEWLIDEFIHILFGLGINSEEMTIKFKKWNLNVSSLNTFES